MEKFQVYKTSAGSGKTFTLVKEYLKWCFKTSNSFYYSKILAITFTNKATLEMKERVVETLQNAINEDVKFNHLNLAIMEELNLPEEELRGLSKKLLSNLLHSYGDFSISTIDKFSHKLVRTFAHDLKIPLNFRVELNLKEVLQNVISAFISSVGSENNYDRWVYSFSFDKLEDNKSWKVENELINLMISLLEERNRRFLEELLTARGAEYIELLKYYKAENEVVFRNIKEKAEKAIQLIQNNGIEPSDFYYGNSGLFVYFQNNTKEEGFVSKPNSYVAKTIEEDNWVSNKFKGTDTESRILGIANELKTYFYDIQKVLDECRSDIIIRKSLIKNLYSVALQQELAKQLNRIKKELNFINMVDINHRIAEVVLSEPMPFVYERLGEKYNHIMIDEFQDTSPLQFANLLPLLEEGLSRGFESMIVGDAKQSIYRFRGGDYKQLSKMPHLSFDNFKEKDLIEMRMDSLRVNYKEKQLETNYRSNQKVIEFNNSIFNYAKNSSLISDETKEIYKGVEQKSQDTSGEGYVQLDVLNIKDDGRGVIFDCLIENIKQCLEDGYNLSDIAILTHKNAQSSEVAQYLKGHQIKAISSEALLLSNSEEIGFIINLISLVANNHNSIARIKAIKHIASKNAESLIDLNTKFENFEKLNSYLNSECTLNLNHFNNLPLVHLVESIIRKLGLDKEYDTYLQFFQDIVFEFSKKEGNDIVQFLEYWEEKSDKFSLDIPPNTDAVNLMTVHRSKGLEFRVVFFPFSNNSKGNHTELKWIEELPLHNTKAKVGVIGVTNDLLETNLATVKQEEDQGEEADLMNRIYVAFTRASERLYIQCESKTPKKNEVLKLSIDNLFYEFLNNTSFLNKQSNKLYSFGERKIKPKIELQKLEEKLEVMEYISHPTYENLEFAIEKTLSPSEFIEKGDIIHEIFYKMNNTEDLGDSIKDAKENFPSFSNWNLIENELKLLIELDLFRNIFNESGTIYKEKEIVDEDGNIFRPDRVIEKKDKNIVVDFKTGKKDKSHLSQIEKYSQLLKSMSNKEVEAYLIYTEELNIEKVA